MSDLIRKYDVVKICNEQIWNGADDYYQISANQIAKKVKELPTIDAVPVIRCKDCKYSLHNQFTGDWYCWLYNIAREVESDGFCYKAERKEE